MIARARRDERGVGIVTVLMLALTIFALGAAWTSFGVHQLQASGLNRLREQARNAAEAGVNLAMSQLTANKDYQGTPSLLSLNDGTGQFEVQVGPAGSDPNARYIVAYGYAPSKAAPDRVARQLEQQVELVPIDGFQYGLFASSSISTANNTTVVGDIYSATDLTLSNYATVAGNIYSQGALTTSNQSTISGDVHAVGNVTLNDAKTTVTGNVFSNASVSMTGTVKGNVQAAGTITGGTVTGARTPNSDPPRPPVQTLPTFTWNPANYSNPLTWSSTSAFNTYFSANRGAFSGAHRVTCSSNPCSGYVALENPWTMTGDVILDADAPVSLKSDITNGTSPRRPVTLTIVSNYSLGTAISLATNLTLPADIRVVLFAPNNCISFRNLKNFTGTVYANCISVDQNFSLTFFPATVPGFSWDLSSASHYKVQSVSFKEVPFGS